MDKMCTLCFYVHVCYTWYCNEHAIFYVLHFILSFFPPKAITRQFAEVLHFALSFDEMKVNWLLTVNI